VVVKVSNIDGFREQSPHTSPIQPSVLPGEANQPEHLVKLKGILDAMADGVYIANQDCFIEYVNPALEKEFGPVNGRRCYEYLHSRTSPCPECKSNEVFGGKTVCWEWTSPRTGRTYDLFDTPLYNADGTISKLEIFHDITEHKQLQREVSQISIREQQRIGQELHDNLGQQLLGMRLMAGSLQKSLEAKSLPEAQTAVELLTALGEAQDQVRMLLKGVRPVDIDSDGLMTALTELAESTQKLSGIECEFLCKQPVPVENNFTATELFHIAQEAVANAVKHAGATRISIGLDSSPQQLLLWIRDNGLGCRSEIGKSSGMGLRIMRHRASILGAALTIHAPFAGGTVVTCKLSLKCDYE
jgi:signal transduction histidine kinase